MSKATILLLPLVIFLSLAFLADKVLDLDMYIPLIVVAIALTFSTYVKVRNKKQSR